MVKTTKDQTKIIDKMKENELWSTINQLLGQHVTAEKKLKLRICQSMALALQIGELLTELKSRWKTLDKAKRPDWKTTVEAHCTVQIREAQRYMRLYKQRDLMNTLYPDWRDELTLTGANKVLSEYYGADAGDDDEHAAHDDNQQQNDDGGDAESRAEDGEKNEESETDSETSEDAKESSGDGETDDGASAFHDFVKTAVGSLKKVNTIIKTSPNPQAVSAIESDLKRLRADCDRRIKQCQRRLDSFPEFENASTAPTDTLELKKRPSKPKPPVRPGRAGYESSPTGMSSMF